MSGFERSKFWIVFGQPNRFKNITRKYPKFGFSDVQFLDKQFWDIYRFRNFYPLLWNFAGLGISLESVFVFYSDYGRSFHLNAHKLAARMIISAIHSLFLPCVSVNFKRLMLDVTSQCTSFVYCLIVVQVMSTFSGKGQILEFVSLLCLPSTCSPWS